MGHARLRSPHRLVWRLGSHRRRRARHGQPGPGGRSVRLLVVQRPQDRHQPGERLGLAGRPDLARGDDVHLLPGHRGVRQLPEGAVVSRGGDAPRLRRHGSRPRSHRACSARAPHAQLVMVQHLPCRFQQHHQRAPLDVVHLLGMGYGGVVQRGDRRLQPDARSGRHHLDRGAAGHLLLCDPGCPGLRRRGHHRGRARQPGPRFGCVLGPGHRRVRQRRRRLDLFTPAHPHDPQLGGGVHPDHDPPQRPHHLVDGRLQGTAQ